MINIVIKMIQKLKMYILNAMLRQKVYEESNINGVRKAKVLLKQLKLLLIQAQANISQDMIQKYINKYNEIVTYKAKVQNETETLNDTASSINNFNEDYDIENAAQQVNEQGEIKNE